MREVEGLVGEDGRTLTLKQQIAIGNEALIVPLNQPLMHEANQFNGNDQINGLNDCRMDGSLVAPQTAGPKLVYIGRDAQQVGALFSYPFEGEMANESEIKLQPNQPIKVLQV